jgi:hypothetical protein
MASACYRGLHDWKSSIQVLEQLFNDFSSTLVMDKLLMTIALTYKNQLKDETGMRAALERLVRQYPRSQLAGTARVLMRTLEKK